MTFEVSSANQHDVWAWPQPGMPDWDDNREGWIRRQESEEQETKIERKAALALSVPTSYKGTIHERDLQAVIDAGEKQIRRTLREWPYGKRLETEIDHETAKVTWYWVSTY
jgi:hypothetical protein